MDHAPPSPYQAPTPLERSIPSPEDAAHVALSFPDTFCSSRAEGVA
jgi:hypothetical protein